MGNADIYNTCVAPLLAKALDGYNTTVLAYGQTGSGKTFTMMEGFADAAAGRETEIMGVAPRLMRDLFNSLPPQEHVVEGDKEIYNWKVSVSCLEIYNEEVYDLLSNEGTKKAKSVIIREDERGEQILAGLQKVAVHSTSQMAEHLHNGMAARHTGSTGMNHRSSRSHAVFTIYLEQCFEKSKSEDDMSEGSGAGSAHTEHVGRRLSKIQLVDLAGSERAKRTGAQGEQLKEGANINRSLLSLGNVIEALARMEDSSGEEAGGKSAPKVHIPYRDSKLTHLLKSSLGGNAYTLMIACASPADSNIEETLSTLRYAARARSIKNKAVLNVDPMVKQLADMRSQLKELRDELMAARAGLPIDGPFGGSSTSKATVRVPLGELKVVNINGYPGHGAPCPCGRTLEIGCNGSSSTAELTKLRAEVKHWQEESKRQEARAKVYRDKANYADIDRDAAIAQLENMAKACRDTISSSGDGAGAQSAARFALDSIKSALQEAEASLITVQANAIASDIQNGEEEPEWDSLVNIDDLVVDGVSTAATSIGSSTFGTGVGSMDGLAVSSKTSSVSSRGSQQMDWDISLDGLEVPAAAPSKVPSSIPSSRAVGTSAGSLQPSRLQAPASEAARRAKQTAAALQSHVDSQRKEIEKVNKKIAETSSLIEAMKGSATAADKAALDKAQQELVSLQSKLQAAMREKDALEAKLNQLQEAIKGEKLLNSAKVQELTAQLEGVKSQLHEKAYQVSSLKEKESEARKLLKLRNESEGKRAQLQEELDELKRNKANLTRALKSQSDAQRAEIKKYQALNQQAQQQVNKLAKAKNEAQSLHDQKDVVLKRHIEEKLRLQAKLREQNVEITKLRSNARMVQGLTAKNLLDSEDDDFDLSDHLAIRHTGKHSFLLNPVDAPVGPSEFLFTLAAGNAASQAAGKGGHAYSTSLINMVNQLVKNKKLTPEYLGVSDDADGVGADDVHPADAAAEDEMMAAAASALGERRFPFDTMLALAECFQAGLQASSPPVNVRAMLEGDVAIHVAYRRTASLIQRLGRERAGLASKKAAAVARGADASEMEQFERLHARYNVSIKEANDLFQTLEAQIYSDKGDGAGAGSKAVGRGAARGKPWRREINGLPEALSAIQFLLTSFATLGHALETSVGAISAERSKGEQRIEDALQQAAQDTENMRNWQQSLQNATNELTILRPRHASEIASVFTSSSAVQELSDQLAKLKADFETSKAAKIVELETEVRILNKELTVAQKEAAEAKLQLEVDKRWLSKSLEGKGKGKGPVSDADIDRMVQARSSTSLADELPAPRVSNGGRLPASKGLPQDTMEDGEEDEDALDEDSEMEEEDDDDDFEDEAVGKKRKRGKNSLPTASRRGSKKAALSMGGDVDEDDAASEGRGRAAGRQSKPVSDTCKCSGTAKGKSCKNCACQKAGRQCGDGCKCGEACANPHGPHKHAPGPGPTELDIALAAAEQAAHSNTIAEGMAVQQYGQDEDMDDVTPSSAIETAAAPAPVAASMPPPPVPSARIVMGPPPLPRAASAGVGAQGRPSISHRPTPMGLPVNPAPMPSSRPSIGGAGMRTTMSAAVPTGRPSMGGTAAFRSSSTMSRPALSSLPANVASAATAKAPLPAARPPTSAMALPKSHGAGRVGVGDLLRHDQPAPAKAAHAAAPQRTSNIFPQ